MAHRDSTPDHLPHVPPTPRRYKPGEIKPQLWVGSQWQLWSSQDRSPLQGHPRPFRSQRSQPRAPGSCPSPAPAPSSLPKVSRGLGQGPAAAAALQTPGPAAHALFRDSPTTPEGRRPALPGQSPPPVAWDYLFPQRRRGTRSKLPPAASAPPRPTRARRGKVPHGALPLRVFIGQ